MTQETVEECFSVCLENCKPTIFNHKNEITGLIAFPDTVFGRPRTESPAETTTPIPAGPQEPVVIPGAVARKCAFYNFLKIDWTKKPI
jgi:hypothetical protein